MRDALGHNWDTPHYRWWHHCPWVHTCRYCGMQSRQPERVAMDCREFAEDKAQRAAMLAYLVAVARVRGIRVAI